MNSSIKKIDQLDALRCLSVLLVILSHYLLEIFRGGFPFGRYGVQIFFTISGFLITSILLKQKEGILSRLSILKNFYIRRTLRIFPLYYLILIGLTILHFCFHIPMWRIGQGDEIYFYTYTTNILFFLHVTGDYMVSHLWSLAVEEQFYLIWPFLILFAPKKKEHLIIFLFIISSFLFKFILPYEYGKTLPIAQFDTLGTGALIAYYLNKDTSNKWIELINKYKTLLIFVSLSFLILSECVEQVFINKLAYFFLVVFCSSLVVGCIKGFKGPAAVFFNNKAVQYLGQISYGIYLFHKWMPFILMPQLEKRLHVHFNHFWGFTIPLLTTVLLAHLSYVFFEMRFLKLKEKFN